LEGTADDVNSGGQKKLRLGKSCISSVSGYLLRKADWAAGKNIGDERSVQTSEWEPRPGGGLIKKTTLSKTPRARDKSNQTAQKLLPSPSPS